MVGTRESPDRDVITQQSKQRESNYTLHFSSLAGYFRGVPIFFIFVEYLHPRDPRLEHGTVPRNLEPRILLLRGRSSFSQNFTPLKITHYTECI